MDLIDLVGGVAATAMVAVALLLAVSRRFRAHVWAGRLPLGVGALPVEEVDWPDSPRAWKAARLVVSDDGRDVRVAGVAMGAPYTVDDAAVCGAGHAHPAPALGCACGFYGLVDRRDAAAQVGRRAAPHGGVVAALCRVEFSGLVIEHQRGFRGERQRVLAVSLLPWCVDCAQWGEQVRADVVAGRPGGVVQRVPVRVGGPSSMRTSVAAPAPPQPLAWAPLEPRCATCAAKIRPHRAVFGLADLAGALATEVDWLPDDVVPTEQVVAGRR